MTETRHTDPVELRGLRLRRQYLHVQGGLFERRKALVVQARRRKPEDGGHAGCGFTATKKVGNAVARNRAKRRLRAAARTLLGRTGLPGIDYVFIARAETAGIAWPRLLDDMESALISLAGKLDGPS